MASNVRPYRAIHSRYAALLGSLIHVASLHHAWTTPTLVTAHSLFSRRFAEEWPLFEAALLNQTAERPLWQLADPKDSNRPASKDSWFALERTWWGELDLDRNDSSRGRMTDSARQDLLPLIFAGASRVAEELDAISARRRWHLIVAEVRADLLPLQGFGDHPRVDLLGVTLDAALAGAARRPRLVADVDLLEIKTYVREWQTAERALSQVSESTAILEGVCAESLWGFPTGDFNYAALGVRADGGDASSTPWRLYQPVFSEETPAAAIAS